MLRFTHVFAKAQMAGTGPAMAIIPMSGESG